VLFVLHPESFMDFIVKVKTKKLSIAESDSFSFVAIDKLSDELGSVFFFYQFLIVTLRLDHVALQILDYQFQQLNPLLGESIFEMFIDLTYKLQVVVNTISIIIIVKETLYVVAQKSQHDTLDNNDHFVISLSLSTAEGLVNRVYLLGQCGKKLSTNCIFFS
jgi:hypothetical protein